MPQESTPFSLNFDNYSPRFKKFPNLRRKYQENAAFMKEKLIINKIKRRIQRDKYLEEVDHSVRASQADNSYDFSTTKKNVKQQKGMNSFTITPNAKNLSIFTDQFLTQREQLAEVSPTVSPQQQQPGNNQVNRSFGLPVLYKIGEFKEYRKKVGLELMKSNRITLDKEKKNNDSFLNNYSPVFQGFDQKSIEKKAEEEQLTQIINDLKEKLTKLEKTNELNNEMSKSKARKEHNSINKHQQSSNNIEPQTSREPQFLPRVAKQKVIDHFVNLSTADVYNQSYKLPSKFSTTKGATIHSNILSPNSGKKEYFYLESIKKTLKATEHSNKQSSENIMHGSSRVVLMKKRSTSPYDNKIHQFIRLKEDYQKRQDNIERTITGKKKSYQDEVDVKVNFNISLPLELNQDEYLPVVHRKDESSDGEEMASSGEESQIYLEKKNAAFEKTQIQNQEKPKAKKKKKKNDKRNSIAKRLQQLEEQRKKIQEQLRNKYYWNNFVMKKDDDQDDADAHYNSNGEITHSTVELRRNLRLLGKYQRFPLSDIYQESKQFFKEIKQKYGAKEFDNLIAQQIDEYKINNQIQKVKELLRYTTQYFNIDYS